MAFGAKVQSKTNGPEVDPSVTAFTNNVTAGNLLLIRFFQDSSGTVTSVTDTRSNTYAEAQAASTSTFRARMWYAIANASGSCTVTIDAATSGIQGVTITEYEGPFSPAAFEVAAGTGNTTGATADSGNITPARDGTLLVGHVVGNNRFTEAGGFTVDDDWESNADNLWILSTHLVQSVAAAESETATHTSALWLAQVAAFRPLLAAFPAAGGSYTISGTSVTFRKNSVLAAVSGTYEITGSSAALITELRDPTIYLTATWPVYDVRLEVSSV